MTSVKIGSARIADAAGTHEPGAVVVSASDALVALASPDAESGKPALNPADGLPWAALIQDAPPAPPEAPQPPPAVQNVQVTATDAAGGKEKA